eukprot:c22325_g1_i1 orf=228-662(+)
MEVGLPNYLTHAAQELYGQVLGIMKTGSLEISRVVCDIGVKQGCPSSPTLFGLYIDKLEQWLALKGGGGLKLFQTTLYNLLYADDVILLASTWRSMQQHIYALQLFCQEFQLKVNLKKNPNDGFSAQESLSPHLFLHGPRYSAY